MKNMLNKITARLNKPVIAAAGAVFVCVTSDTTGPSTLVVGKDCARLTKRFQKFKVSAHVLPGVKDNGSPCFAIIGTSHQAVLNAFNDWANNGDGSDGTSDDPTDYSDSVTIVRCPI